MSRPRKATSNERLEALLRAYEAVFDSPEGRLVEADLLFESGLMEVSHAPGDPYDTAFQEGRRSMGLHLLRRRRQDMAALHRIAAARAEVASAQADDPGAETEIDTETGEDS